VVPTLVLEDAPHRRGAAIMRYLDEGLSREAAARRDAEEQGPDRDVGAARRAGRLRGGDGGRAQQIARLKAAPSPGRTDYEQIPALVERSVLRVKNFFADLNERLTEVPFVAGERYSARTSPPW